MKINLKEPLYKPRGRKSPNRHYAVSKKLRQQGKSNEEFEFLISINTFEDIIALKLESVFKIIGRETCGIPIWEHFTKIIKDAILRAALTVTKSEAETIRMLGISERAYYKFSKRAYDIKEELEEFNKTNEGKLI